VIVWQGVRMSVRPYPSRDRALRQILRRRDLPLPQAAQPTQAGRYVLSTRRPGTVGGPS